MKILHVIRRLEIGGGPTSAVALANSLCTVSGLDIHVASENGPISEKLLKTVKFHQLRDSNSLTFQQRLKLIVTSVQPDLLHLHGSRLTLETWLGARFFRWRRPIISTRHSHGFRFVPDGMAVRLINLTGLNTIVLSENEYRHMLSEGANASRLFTIPHAMDIEGLSLRFDSLDRTVAQQRIAGKPLSSPVVSVACRLVNGKGLGRFIDVISALHASGIPATGIIAGIGPLEERLKAKVIELGLEDAVHFVGFQPRIDEVLAASDVVLFLSEVEVLPVFLIEAMACGIPAVTSRIAAHENLITHGQNGLLVSNVDEATSAIRRLTESPTEHAAIASSARYSAARFSAPVVISKLVDLYREIAASRQ